MSTAHVNEDVYVFFVEFALLLISPKQALVEELHLGVHQAIESGSK